MDVQTIFYSVGTVFMLLGILIMVAVIYFLWKVEKSAMDFKKNIGSRVGSFCSDKKSEIVSVVGVGLLTFLLNKLRKHLKKD